MRLEDIAKVELGAEEYDLDVRFSNKRAVLTTTVACVADVSAAFTSPSQEYRERAQ